MSDTGKIVALIKALSAKVDPSVIESAVSDWLDDHPEATTTVEDGSITKAKLDEDLQETVDDVSSLKTEITNVKGRNRDAIDGIYASCRYHQPNASAKQFCLLVGTDFHADSDRLNNMVELLNALDAFDAGICLGDIAGNTWEDDATYYTTAISKAEKPFLTVIGNHDAGYGNTPSTSYTNIADLVEKFITPNIQYANLASGEYPSGKSYYYKDFGTYGIRLIVMNSYEYPTDMSGNQFLYTRGSNCWSQDQIDWFVSTLNSTPSAYGVIVATHYIPCSISVNKDSIWTSSTEQYAARSPDTMLTSEDRYLLADIVNAWIGGSALSKTYSYKVSGTWTGITVSADFTSRGGGEFITWLGGHLHWSELASIYAYSNQNVYLVDASGLSASTQGDTPRKAGTKSEDCLCVISVDRDTKTVKLFRVGAHFTKDAVDRLYGKYTYSVPCTGLEMSDSTHAFTSVGSTKQLTVTKTPATATDAVSWISSDSSVATVNASGLVTCTGVGTATITATCGSATATCAVSATVVIDVTNDLVAVMHKGVSSTDLSTNPPKDYLSLYGTESGTNLRRIGFLSGEVTPSGYKACSGTDSWTEGKYPIMLPNNASEITISFEQTASITNYVYVFADSTQQPTYNIGGKGCLAKTELTQKTDATSSGFSFDVPDVEGVDSFIFSITFGSNMESVPSGITMTIS